VGIRTIALEDSEDPKKKLLEILRMSRFEHVLVTGHNLDLALLRELADLVHDLLGGGLEPTGHRPAVGDRGTAYSFTVGVKTTHRE
jgi:hypothetical protein